MVASGKPCGEWRTVMGCSKKLENHLDADAVSPGKANVVVGILRWSPGTESVTDLRSGAKAARIKWIAAVRLPFTQWPSTAYSAQARSCSTPPPGPMRASFTG